MNVEIMIIILLCLIDAVLSLNAYVVLHCDNNGTIFESTDNGTTFKFIKNEDDWMQPLQTSITDVTSNTILRFKCEDNENNHGGFISTIKYKNIQYSTTNPITNGFFMLITSSYNKTSPLVYKKKTADRWKTEITGSISSDIANDAYWIWNGEIGNTMTFEFNFADLPTEIPFISTSNTSPYSPTVKPRMMDNEQQTTADVKHEGDTATGSDSLSLLIALLIVIDVFICCIVILIMWHKKVCSINKEENEVIQIELESISCDKSIDYIVNI